MDYHANNDRLLSMLHEEKRRFRMRREGAAERKDYLRDPVISGLVAQLAKDNIGLVTKLVAKYKALHPRQDDFEDMMQTAYAGRGSMDAQPTGLLGGIVSFDYSQQGLLGFQAYLGQAVWRSLAPNETGRLRERLRLRQRPLPQDNSGRIDEGALGEMDAPPWRALLAREAVEALLTAARGLPEDTRAVAVYCLEHFRATGGFPTNEAIGRMATGVACPEGDEVNHKQRMRDTGHRRFMTAMEAAFERCRRDNPQMAEGMVTMEEFLAPLGRGARRGGRAGP